jgi:hypothetical protein
MYATYVCKVLIIQVLIIHRFYSVCIAAGNWVFLKPGALQSGNHEISFTGKLNGIRSDVSYSLDLTDS